MAKDARAVEQSADGPTGELTGMRVAILAEALYEDLELWYPYYRLREAGATSSSSAQAAPTRTRVSTAIR